MKEQLLSHAKYVKKDLLEEKILLNMQYFIQELKVKKLLHNITKCIIKYKIQLKNILFIIAFKCDKCTKAFSTKSSLQAHLNTHRREPPQSCVECNRVFIRQDCLMRHIKAKHRDLLEDVMNEVERKHLQIQLYNIATVAVQKTKNGNSTRLSPDKLVEAVTDLLKILIDEDTLQV